jgi:hypothetical protein
MKLVNTKSPANKILAMTLPVLVSTAVVSGPSFAGVALNTIDPIAVVADDGHRLVVTGPIACTAGERVALQVTVTQRTTGAVAQERIRFTCTGDVQHWEVQAKSVGETPFVEGAATAVARVRTTAEGEATDAHQWLVAITLTK